VAELFQTILNSLDAARELCGLLDRYPGQVLTTEQTAVLGQRRGSLLESLSKLIARNEPEPEPEAESPAAPTPAKLNWVTQPVDHTTDLPDRAAFDANLKAVLDLSRAARRDSSLLLIRVDKMSGLVSRFGQAQTDKLLKRLAGLICRCVRDDDLVCRCNAETLAVIMPGLDLEEGTRLGKLVRDAVRNGHFRGEETGPEVLLTASFGCTPCRAEENPEIVLTRAFDALSKSQRLGRNQLHVHDGATLVHCVAG
jgi:diguanylate cyclase (GGDEF)-like protein